ncbi:MAG: VanW family protein, partial [Eubacteriales bacterium]|nr:VanW family protein [Eubacteriales bacterium]
KKLRQRRLMVLLAFVLLCFILLYAITTIRHHRYVSGFEKDKAANNVHIGSVDVSGMTEDEIVAKLGEQNQTDLAKKISLKLGDQEATMTMEEAILEYSDVRTVAKEAVEYGKSGSLSKRYRTLRRLRKKPAVIEEDLKVDPDKVKEVIGSRTEAFTEHAKDATLNVKDGELVIEPESTGETVDVERAFSDLETVLKESWDHEDITIKLEVKEEDPEVKEADLSDVRDELGTYSTDVGTGERVVNIQLGVKKVNGTIVMPGEELSFDKVTGPFDEYSGYVPAGSYESGQVVDTYGGGICQVSTTLYNAVLYSELEIVQRGPHSMLVSYVDPSRDAMIADDVMDFVFKNSTEYPIYIFGEIDSNNQLRFTIYGKDTREKGRTIDFESEILSTEEAGVAYRASSELYLGGMQTKSDAHTGMDAILWKIIYKDGEEVSREQVNASHYQKTDKIIEVGIKTDNQSAAQLVINAISSQDAATIQSAINQAASMG